MEVVENSDIVILAVKPHIYPTVLKKIKSSMRAFTILLTIAAGFSIEKVEKILGTEAKVVRAMSNTPAQVLEGMTAVAFNQHITEEEKQIIFKIFNSFGKSIELEEKLFHAFTGISGSLSAYVYMFVEVLGDAGVLESLSRNQVYEIISQAVLGSAKILLETGKHPGQLKDEVTSPRRTTIEAIKVLENGNFRGTLINAAIACTEKSKKLAGE